MIDTDFVRTKAKRRKNFHSFCPCFDLNEHHQTRLQHGDNFVDSNSFIGPWMDAGTFDSCKMKSADELKDGHWRQLPGKSGLHNHLTKRLTLSIGNTEDHRRQSFTFHHHKIMTSYSRVKMICKHEMKSRELPRLSSRQKHDRHSNVDDTRQTPHFHQNKSPRLRNKKELIKSNERGKAVRWGTCSWQPENKTIVESSSVYKHKVQRRSVQNPPLPISKGLDNETK
jgi:hypothetical protein